MPSLRFNMENGQPQTVELPEGVDPSKLKAEDINRYATMANARIQQAAGGPAPVAQAPAAPNAPAPDTLVPGPKGKQLRVPAQFTALAEGGQEPATPPPAPPPSPTAQPPTAPVGPGMAQPAEPTDREGQMASLYGRSESGPPGAEATPEPKSAPADVINNPQASWGAKALAYTAAGIDFLSDPPPGEKFGQNPDGAYAVLSAAQRRIKSNMSTLQDPQATRFQKFAATASLGFYAAQPEYLGIESTSEGVSRSLGARGDTATLVGDMAGMARAGLELPGQAYGMYQKGKALVNEYGSLGEALKVGTKSVRESVMSWLKPDIESELGRWNGLISKRYDALETAARTVMPTVVKGAPGYEQYGAFVQHALGPNVPQLPADVVRSLNMANTRYQQGLPFMTEDIIGTYKKLEHLSQGTGGLDTSAATRFAGTLHGMAKDAFAQALPRDIQTMWQGTTADYKNYAESRTALAFMYDRNVSGVEAFNQMFQLKDPRAFRAAAEMIDREPGIAVKLRAGLADSLKLIGGQEQDPRAIISALNAARDPMVNLGVIKAEDFTTLQRLYQAKDFGHFMSNVGASLTSFVGTAAAGSYAFHLAANDPHTLLMAITAAGAVPLIRKMYTLTYDTPAWKQAAKALVGRMNQSALDVSRMHSQHSPPASLIESQINFHGSGGGSPGA